MKKIFFFYLSLLTTINGLTAQNNNSQILNAFFDNLINLDYTQAENELGKLEDLTLKTELEQLTSLLYYNGQEVNYQIYVKEPSIEEGSLVDCISSLNKAYDLLFHHPNAGNSFHFFFSAYTISKELGRPYLTKFCLLSILEFYHFEYSQTNDQFEKYLEEFDRQATTPIYKCWSLLYRIYFNSQSIHSEKWKSPHVLSSLEEQVNFIDENHRFLGLFYSIKAVQLEFTGDFDQALDYHKQAVEHSKDIPFLKYLVFRSYIRISEIYYKQNKYHEGLATINSAKHYIDISDTLRGNIYINKYKSKHNNKLGNYLLSYEQLRKSIELEHEIEYKTNMLQKSTLEVQLQTAEKEKSLLIEKQKRKQNRTIAIVLGFFLCLGLTITILLQKNSTKRRKLVEKEIEIEKQKVNTLLKEQELISIDAMISGQEHERQRVANELHDDLGSLMATIKLHFENIKTDKQDPARKNTAQLIDKAYEKIRGIAHAKNSGVFANQGLVPAIQKMASTITEAEGIELEVTDFELNERIENSLELTIFRIIQELFANIIRHSEATKASIQLTQHETSLNIIIEDNGIGFKISDLGKNKSGMGLTNIEKRIENLNGNFTIDSIEGKGTSLIIDLPI